MILNKYFESELDDHQLIQNLITRLRNFFFIDETEEELIKSKHPLVIEKLYKCFLNIDNKYFKHENERLKFSYAHSGQYLIYLYFYSRIFADLKHPLKDKLYYLNKIMHGVDIYCEVELPETFYFEHPIGMILGRASYGNNFIAMQGCTVGGNKGIYPIIGMNVKMFSQSKTLGNCNIGNNVWISANTYIKDQDVPSNCIVFGSSPNLIIKEIK